MRVAFQVVAVLEGARLALVGIDRHEARAGKAAHDLPLLAGREAGAAEAAQAGVGEDLDELLRRPLVGEAGAQRSDEHTSELQSLMRTPYAVFCLKKKNTQ